MKFPKIEECNKGDITSIEICVERSSAKNDVWITMWKNEYEHFQVTLIDKTKRGRERYKILREYPKHEDDEAKARSEYVKACDANGCLPYS